MDDLIKLVVQKTGISEEQAKTAVQTVIGFLKERLPAPIASQVDGPLSGGGLAGIAKSLGGLFGNK